MYDEAEAGGGEERTSFEKSIEMREATVSAAPDVPKYEFQTEIPTERRSRRSSRFPESISNSKRFAVLRISSFKSRCLIRERIDEQISCRFTARFLFANLPRCSQARKDRFRFFDGKIEICTSARFANSGTPCRARQREEREARETDRQRIGGE